MNREQLLAALQFLFAENAKVGLSMYFIIKTDTGLEEKMADISPEVRDDLKKQFLEYIQTKFTNNPHLYFANVTEADNRANAAYYYDLDAQVEGLEAMPALLKKEEREYFKFTTDNFDKVVGFVFLLGNERNKIALYKKHIHLNVIKRDSVLSLIRSEKRLVKVNDDIIKLNEHFDFMQIDTHLVIVSLKTFERYFGFAEAIKHQALLNLVLISGANLLESTEPLKELVEETRFARKLMRVKTTSKVLQLPFDKIKHFIQNHPKLKRRMRFNDAGTKIDLDTRTSKELFLKLLDDDFLKSDLTDILYEAENKDRLDDTEATEE